MQNDVHSYCFFPVLLFTRAASCLLFKVICKVPNCFCTCAISGNIRHMLAVYCILNGVFLLKRSIIYTGDNATIFVVICLKFVTAHQFGEFLSSCPSAGVCLQLKQFLGEIQDTFNIVQTFCIA